MLQHFHVENMEPPFCRDSFSYWPPLVRLHVISKLVPAREKETGVRQEVESLDQAFGIL